MKMETFRAIPVSTHHPSNSAKGGTQDKNIGQEQTSDDMRN
jgi:hypothetical protein